MFRRDPSICFASILKLIIIACLFYCPAEAYALASSGEEQENGNYYTLQFGAFSDKSRAEEHARALNRAGLRTRIVTAAGPENGISLYKVRAGKYPSREEANKTAKNICKGKNKKFTCVIIKIEQHAEDRDTTLKKIDLKEKPPQNSSYNQARTRQLINPFKGMLGVSYIEIEPAFSYRLYYEDNVAGGRGNEIEDFSNRYLPELDFALSTPRLSIEGHTEAEIIEYFDEKDWNTVDQEHTLNAVFTQNKRLSYSVGGGYIVESDSDRYFEEGGAPGLEGGYTVQRYKNKTKFLAARCMYDYSRKLNIQWMLTYSNFETAVTDDTDFYFSTLTFNYKFSDRTTLNLTNSYQFFDFTFGGPAEYDDDFLEDLVAEDSFELFQDSDFEMKTYNISLGITQNFSDDCTLSLNGGWRYTENDRTTTNLDPQTGQSITTNNKKSGDGFTFSFNFTKSFSYTELNLLASQNVGKNPDTGSTYEHRRLQISVTQEITRRLRAALRCSFHTQETDPDDEFGFDIDRENLYFNAELSYRWKRWLTAYLNYAYSNNDNKNFGLETERNTFFLGLRFTPLRPYVYR